MMKHAKRSLDMQEDSETHLLLTIGLLITWSQLLLDSSQDALGIILQDSKYGKEYFPISTARHRAARHRAAKNPEKPKGSGHMDDQLKENTRGFYEVGIQAHQAEPLGPNKIGCGDFCQTGQFHPRFICPCIVNGKITEAKLKKNWISVAVAFSPREHVGKDI